MQEKDKNVSTVKFLTVFGTEKLLDAEEYFVEDDITDQRAPVNDPQALYEQFVVPEDIMDELEDEKLEDFDNDIYPYDDRTDYGVDIAAAANLDLKKSIENIKKIKEKKAAPEEQAKVNEAADDSEA